MSKPVVAIIGESGTGKSSSLDKLPPDRTIIINTELKPLPMRNFNDFKNVMADTVKKFDSVIAQLSKSDKYDYVVLDSFTSLCETVYGYTSKAFTNYEIWGMYNEIIYEHIRKLKKLPQQVFIIALPEQKDLSFGETKAYARVKGKELKFGGLEKELAVVLFTKPEYDEDTGEMLDVKLAYKANKFNTAKSPRDMFEKEPTNDALFIAESIQKYYGDN